MGSEITIAKLINYIEDNMFNRISLDDVENYIGISKFFLDKYFFSMTGYTIIEYLRNRRLYLAALDILNTKDNIISIAYKYLYESQESFIRAFKKRYNYSPIAFRKAKPYIKRFPRLEIEISISGGESLDYEIIEIPKTKYIGFEYNLPEKGFEGKIAKLWADFYEKYEKLCNCKNRILREAIINNKIGQFGIGINLMKGQNMKYLIAGEYLGGPIPKELKIYEYEKTKMIRFKNHGSLIESMYSLFYEIINKWSLNYPNIKFVNSYQIEEFNKTGSKYNVSIAIPTENDKV